MLVATTAADRLIIAALSGTASRHARFRELTAEEHAAAAELREIAVGRSDLLAEHAGIMLGVAAIRLPDEAERHRQMAELCIAGGADETLIPAWTEVGRERAEGASAVPYTGI